jgi:putative membrane protein insertion efficiency factor
MFEAFARLPQQGLMALVHGYRYLLKPWLGNRCRFEPTCSAYALQALQRHGALGGSALAGWRVLRCQPWCAGGCDPVPDNLPHPAAGLFSRLGLHTDAKAAVPRPPTRKLP